MIDVPVADDQRLDLARIHFEKTDIVDQRR